MEPQPHIPIDRAVLVIGYGNSLRRDDGVGPLAAEAVSGRGVTGVEALAVHQLTPELAEPLAAAAVAIFVDARLSPEHGTVRVEAVHPSPGRGDPLGHVGDPASLIALASAVYGGHPAAWVVSIPATDLGLGEGLSPTAARGLAEAIDAIGRLIGQQGPPASSIPEPNGGASCTKSR